VDLRLRPYRPEDLPIDTSSDSPYDAFGPVQVITTLPPAGLQADGHLVIEVDGRIIGDVGWHWLGYGPGQPSRCPNIGISIWDPADRGGGRGTEAQRMLVDVLFSGTTINRIEASTDVTNLAEQRALEKAGFTREGVVRGAQWRAGAYHDLVTFSVLRSDWAG
jgi:RimJ/RimL family protein N-acetyltransferase